MLIYENRPSKMFFWCQGISLMNFDLKMGGKMN